MNKENKNLYLAHADDWDNRDLLRISQTVSDVATYINRSDDPYLILEITALKLLEMDKSVSLDKLFESGSLHMEENDQVIELKKTVKMVFLYFEGILHLIRNNMEKIGYSLR